MYERPVVRRMYPPPPSALVMVRQLGTEWRWPVPVYQFDSGRLRTKPLISRCRARRMQWRVLGGVGALLMLLLWWEAVVVWVSLPAS